MTNKNQHVVPLGASWAVKREGSKKFTLITETKRDALTVARQIAKNNKSELVVHGKDGKIERRDSFSNKDVKMVRRDSLATK